jgi:hypothetical protein
MSNHTRHIWLYAAAACLTLLLVGAMTTTAAQSTEGPNAKGVTDGHKASVPHVGLTPTPTCCQLTGNIQTSCSYNPGSNLYTINFVADIVNSCGQTITVAANFYLEASTDNVNFDFVARTSIQNYVFQPGHNIIPGVFTDQSMPPPYQYYRVRMQIYDCGIYSIYSPSSPLCGVATPTPTPGCVLQEDYHVTTSAGATMVPANNYVAGSGCSQCTVSIPLPFSYSLYTQTFTSVNLSSEGNLQFVSNTPTGSNACLPTNTLNYAIMPYWNDLDAFIDDTMGYYSAVVGTAPNRIFVLRYHGGRIAADTIFDFEVLLYEGQYRFDVIYGTVHERGFSATIGVQKATGERYTQYSCDTQSINQGTRLVFDRRVCPTSRSGPVGRP